MFEYHMLEQGVIPLNLLKPLGRIIAGIISFGDVAYHGGFRHGVPLLKQEKERKIKIRSFSANI